MHLSVNRIAAGLGSFKRALGPRENASETPDTREEAPTRREALAMMGELRHHLRANWKKGGYIPFVEQPRTNFFARKLRGETRLAPVGFKEAADLLEQNQPVIFQPYKSDLGHAGFAASYTTVYRPVKDGRAWEMKSFADLKQLTDQVSPFPAGRWTQTPAARAILTKYAIDRQGDHQPGSRFYQPLEEKNGKLKKIDYRTFEEKLAQGQPVYLQPMRFDDFMMFQDGRSHPEGRDGGEGLALKPERIKDLNDLEEFFLSENVYIPKPPRGNSNWKGWE